MVIKSKASVYERTNSVRNSLRASLRRKTISKRFLSSQVSEEEGGGAAAWWQQTSIDMGDAAHQSSAR